MPTFLPPVVYPLAIDALGASESVPIPFNFSTHWEIESGDTLAASPAPTIVGVAPRSQAPITIGTPSPFLASNTWTAQVSIANGLVGNEYRLTCTAKTENGSTLVLQVNVQLVGVGYQSPTPAPPPSYVVPANQVLAGPTSGGSALAGYRFIVSTDLPLSGSGTGSFNSPTLMPNFGFDQYGRIISFSTTTMVVVDGGGQVFNLMAPKYGIVANNSTDNWAGIQSCVNDACAVNGIVLVPGHLSNYIAFSKTVVFAPPNGATVPATVGFLGYGKASGLVNQFNFTGSAQPAFSFQGCWLSQVRGIGVGFGTSGQTGAVGFDYVPTPNADNNVFTKFSHCNVSMGSLVTACIGFRIGQSLPVGNPLGSASAFSAANNVTYELNQVSGTTNTNGHIAYQIGGMEAFMILLLNNWSGEVSTMCLDGNIAAQLNGAITGTGPIASLPVKAFTGLQTQALQSFPQTTYYVQIDSEILQYTGVDLTPGANALTGVTRGAFGTTPATHATNVSVNLYTPGQGVYTGCGHLTSICTGSSHCLTDWLLVGPANAAVEYEIRGGRFEQVHRFLQQGYGAAIGGHVLLSGINVVGYNDPGDNFGLCKLVAPCTFRWTGGTAFDSTSPFSHSHPLVYTGAPSIASSVTVEDVALYTLSGTRDFINNQNNWNVEKKNISILNSTGLLTDFIPHTRISPPIVLTDAANVTLDCANGSVFFLDLTSAVGATRTVTLADAYAGREEVVLYTRQPATGGPCAITWAGVVPNTATNLTFVGPAGGAMPTLSTAAGAIDIIRLTQPVSGTIRGALQ